MKVLQISKYYYPFSGGLELVAKKITQVLVDSNICVEILAFDKISENANDCVGPFGEGIQLLREHIKLCSAPLSFTAAKIIKRYIIDTKDLTHVLVHLPNPLIHHIIWRNRKLLNERGIKVVAIYHSDVINQKYLGPVYNNVFQKTINVYDKFVVAGPQNYENSNTIGNIPRDIVKIIPFIPENTSDYYFREKFNGNVLAIGRLVTYKGFEYLMRAVKESGHKLKIIGRGPLFKHLSQFKTDDIELLGHVSDEEKNELIKWAGIMAVPSINRSEAFGMTITEAFAAGLPVLTCKTGSALEYLASGGRSVLINPESVSELKESLIKLDSDEQLYKSIGLRAKKFSDDKLSYVSFKKNITQLIQEDSS